MTETIVLKPKTWQERQKELPLPLRILTSPKLTIGLGLTLGALLTGGALAPAATGAILRGAPAVLGKGALKVGKAVMPKTVKGAIGAAILVPTAAGVLKASPKARELVKTTLDPRESVKRGEYLAGIIEDPESLRTQLKEEGLWETIKKSAKGGGKYAAIAAGILGAGVAIKTKAPQKAVSFLKEQLEKRKIAKELEAAKEAQPISGGMRQMGFTEPQPVGLGGVPVSVTPISGIGAPGEEKKQPAVSNIIQIQVS